MFGHKVGKRHFGTPACCTWLLIHFLDVARKHPEILNSEQSISRVDKLLCGERQMTQMYIVVQISSMLDFYNTIIPYSLVRYCCY